jgi:hypothetical protein
MALTLETGTGSETADAFASVAQARSYASSRGLTLPPAAEGVERLLRRAADYVLSRESFFSGKRVKATQALPFPRKKATLHGEPLGEDVIPQTLIQATCQIACDLVDIEDALPLGTGREVVQSTVGPISTTYASSGRGVVLPVLTKAEVLLSPLYSSQGLRLVVDRA